MMLASSVLNFRRKLTRKVGILANRVEAAWFDFKSGTSTRGKAAATNLDIEADNIEHLTGYQAVNERHLRTVLESIDFPANSTFLDIGCGKGKVLIIAASYDLVGRAFGIELSGSLCRDARENIEKIQSRRRSDKPITVVQQDAAKYEFNNGENIVFTNNPFDWAIMSTVVDHMCNAARQNSQDMFFIYYNPVNAGAIEADGRLQLLRQFTFFGPGRNTYVYRIPSNLNTRSAGSTETIKSEEGRSYHAQSDLV